MARFEDMRAKKHATYMDSLSLVSSPREYGIDADGHFVGYDIIEELLDYRLSKFMLTNEEHQYLVRRLHQEQELDDKED